MKADSGIEAIHGCKFLKLIKDEFQNARPVIHVRYFFSYMAHNSPFKETFPSIPICE